MSTAPGASYRVTSRVEHPNEQDHRGEGRAGDSLDLEETTPTFEEMETGGVQGVVTDDPNDTERVAPSRLRSNGGQNQEKRNCTKNETLTFAGPF